MRKRISRIAPVQLGKISAVFYAILSIPLALFFGIVSAFSPSQDAMPLGMLIAIPIVYIVAGFVFMALGALLYNVIVRWTGGIEFESEEVGDA